MPTSLSFGSCMLKLWDHGTPIRMKKLRKNWHLRNADKTRESIGIQDGTATLENNLAVSYKANIVLLYNPATALLNIYPIEMNIYVHTKTWRWIFIAALFIIAENWKLPRCLQ